MARGRPARWAHPRRRPRAPRPPGPGRAGAGGAARPGRLAAAALLVSVRDETVALCALCEWRTGPGRWSILIQRGQMLERRRQGPSREAVEQAALSLLARHGSHVLATARRYAASPEDAEDAYQR